jgi:energy-coupling factor transporter ATP-binding protein EcfA2
MSTNAMIERVAYIGWRGITGCEVLDLHEELTGLIGPSGAGKSTLVMCLDYAILPDRRTLDIRPISDLHDSHNSGTDSLASRINPAYGYAYVVLEIAGRDGKQLIAGIHVEPVDGRAHFTPWLIRNVPENALLQDLLSVRDGDSEYFPDFPELKRHLASNGIDVTTCRTVGEYGQALYEAGIIPSSMTSTADRTLYANLIETTFKGGISQEVATKLKDYLLPAQSQVQELVRGLQECTNDVLKTRSAVASATKELSILKSTYGVGKDAVRTALRCIGDDVKQAEETIQGEQSTVANKQVILDELEKSIPSIVQQIEVTAQSKKTALSNSLLELNLLGDKKTSLWGARKERESKMEAASNRLKRFNEGGKIWRKVAGQYEREGYEQVNSRLQESIEGVARKIYGIELEMRKLQEEDARLSSERSSTASEHLVELLGGQSLEQALEHVSEKESVALEMTLGGLTEGVVGVDLDELVNIHPSQDIPDMFWLGTKMPSTRPIRETGDWYVSAVADGYIVASKDRASVFGSEARKMRRQTIAKELNVLTEKHSIQGQEKDRENEKLTVLLKNDEVIQIYLHNRQDTLAIDQAAKDTKKAFEQSDSEYKTAEVDYLKIQEKIEKIEEPYENSIKSLGLTLSEKRAKKPLLVRDIDEAEKRIKAVNERLEFCRREHNEARLILGSEFDRFCADAMNAEIATHNVYGSQAKRIAELCKSLGDETVLRYKSFVEVDSQERLSIVRLWPDLMSVVRETISIDLADRDGEDLMEAMQKNRANLDSDLARQENEVRINARSIFLNINSAVRSQKVKIDKLSRLGQNIQFGNVTGIRIQLSPRSEMLNILEQFADQLSLFNKEKPVDQVMKEFFEEASSGGIKMDGEHLLDYRNYVDLVIESRRMVGQWEPAASLSGGESIGCGLAIALMLTRSIANRVEAGGDGIKTDQIRPLFAVDEANRLDPAGQKMLVEFAKREHFQLLVTAPSLKPNFNCTLYALSRIFTPEERLIIRGVRVRNTVSEVAA